MENLVSFFLNNAPIMIIDYHYTSTTKLLVLLLQFTCWTLTGQVGTKVRTAVNSGSSFHDANTLAEVLVSDGGIKATSVRIFTPSREVQYEFDDSACKLSDYHKITVEPGGIRCYYISGYGPGHFFSSKEVLDGWGSCCCVANGGSLTEPKDYQVDHEPSSTDDDGVQIYSLEKAADRKEKKIMGKLKSQHLSKAASNEKRLETSKGQGIFPVSSH